MHAEQWWTLAALLSIVWVLISLVRALFRSRRRSALRQAAVGTAAVVASCVMILVSIRNEIADAGVASFKELLEKRVADRQELARQETAARKEAETRLAAEKEQQRRQAAAAAVVARQRELADYVERLRNELEDIPTFNAHEFAGSASQIAIAVGVFQAWADSVDKGSRFELTPEQESLRQSFRRAVARKQAQSLPALRDAFGPAMRKELWEADAKARTFGSGFRTIEFIAGQFAANRNIKTAFEASRKTLLMLRFTRAQYKWLDADVEYSYYTLEPPKDDAVVVWSGESWRTAR